MQISVWTWLRKNGYTEIDVVRDYSEQSDTYVRHSVQFEYPFVQEGRIISFADICSVFIFDVPYGIYGQVQRKFFYDIFEVKPRIYSVGALIRQCSATRITVENWRPAKDRFSRDHKLRVTPVVRSDDPNIGLLGKVCNQFATWDGDNLEILVRKSS